MADIYPPPNSIAPPDSQSQTETKVLDKNLPAYKYAKALCETARSVAKTRTDRFAANKDFMLGKGHWGSPATSAAVQIDQDMFKGVVNWSYSVIKTKAAILTGAQAETFVEPLDDQSSYYDRLLVKSAIDHEKERLRFKDVKRDMYLTASWCGVGIGMYSAKPDPLTGAMILALSAIKPEDFFCDPSADSITSSTCRFVVWEPELDMSTVREMWPSKAPYVKPTIRQVTGGFTYKPDHTDDNLIYGTAGEFVVDQTNMLRSRKARVAFVWVKDESIIEDLHEVLIKNATMGYECVSCGAMYEFDALPMGPTDQCPTCGGNLEDAEIPAKYEQNRVIRRKYPYGRLIVYSGETLLFDGENPYELEEVFPFFVYHHERIPGDFHGANDVELMKSLQNAQDITVCQLVHYVRLGVNAPILYPSGYQAITDLGNGPNQKLPGPDRLPWMPQRLSVQGFDVQSWGALHNALDQHFQVVSGLGSIGFSQTSSPPISATEAEIANARLSDRMKGHAYELACASTNAMSIQWQMMRQFYDQPMGLMVTMPDSTVKSIEVEVQKLPKVSVRVVIDTDLATKDKLLGQNLAGFAQSGGMESPYADIILGKFGFSTAEIKEFMARRGLQQELLPPGAANQLPASAPPQPQPQGVI